VRFFGSHLSDTVRRTAVGRSVGPLTAGGPVRGTVSDRYEPRNGPDTDRSVRSELGARFKHAAAAMRVHPRMRIAIAAHAHRSRNCEGTFRQNVTQMEKNIVLQQTSSALCCL
jgi:hypothetical protein